MLCNRCKKRQASMFLTQVINSQKIEGHFCEQCAQEISGFQFNYEVHGIFNKFLTGLLGNELNTQLNHQVHQQRCSKCELPFNLFMKNGKIGCSNCYNDFKEEMLDLLRRIHGSNNHIGKIPKRAGVDIKLEREISQYRNEMQIAIKSEEFERAAELRDKIKSLEQKIRGDL
jgi:protein arginine kinase activator